MAVVWHKTDFLGVRYREHRSRKHGIMPDRCFSVRYKINGRDKEEVVGWASEGWTPESVYNRLSKIRENLRSGEGATSLQEERELNLEKKAEEERVKNEQKKHLITVREYWEQTFKDHLRRTLKKDSYRTEIGHMEVWILPLLGDRPLIHIGFKEWDALIRTMDKRKRSQRTKQYTAGTLCRMLRHAQDRGLPVTLPSSRQIGAQAPKNNRRRRILTQEESGLLLDCIGRRDLSAARLTRFCMYTGCRLSEAVNLKWANVFFAEQSVRFVNTKNKDSRTVYLAPEALEMLTSMQASDHGATSADNVFLRKNGCPFTLKDGRAETPSVFRDAVTELGLNVGRDDLDRVTFHTIRHTVATHLAKVLDVRALMDVMGWHSIEMAARYIHSQEEAKRKAAKLLAGAWEKPETATIIPFRKQTGGG